MNIAKTLADATVDQLLARHRAFWGRGEVEAPLCQKGAVGTLEGDIGVAPYHVTADTLRLEQVGDELENTFAEQGVIAQDLFRLAPYTRGRGFAWIEAILGCPIRTSSAIDTYWAEPLPGGIDQAIAITRQTGRSWRAEILRLGRTIANRCQGRYPLGSIGLRGPVDFLAAMLGYQGMCEALLDRPQTVLDILDVSTDIWIDLARQFNAQLPAFQGGSFNSYSIWAPGTTATFNVDAACIISVDTYREFFLPFDRRICQAFEYPVIHTHCVAKHHWPTWLEIDNLTLQAVVDPVGPSISELLPAFLDIQRQRALIILLLEDQFDLALDTLSPRGLQVSTYYP